MFDKEWDGTGDDVYGPKPHIVVAPRCFYCGKLLKCDQPFHKCECGAVYKILNVPTLEMEDDGV